MIDLQLGGMAPQLARDYKNLRDEVYCTYGQNKARAKVHL
jgi:hypothetical protein